MSAGPTPAPAAGVKNPWVLNVLRPLGLTIMAACVALPVAQLIAALAPGLHVWFLLAASVLATLEICYTHRIVREQYGVDIWRLRVIEAGVFFVVLRAASVALHGLPTGAPGEWLLNPFWWLEGETMLAVLLAISFALAADHVLQDFDSVGETVEIDKNYVSSVDSLTSEFFAGGAVLLIVAGLSRVNLMTVFNTDRPPVAGLVGNVLVYFLVGLLLISQVRLELLAVRWQAQGVRTPFDLTQRWVRYSLLFVGLCALLAFVLPTGFTLSTLGVLGGLVGYAFEILWVIAFLLISLIVLPFNWLASLLRGSAPPALPDQPPPPPPPNITQLAQQPLPPWVNTVRDVVVIAVLIAFITYLLWNYLRDRPELIGSLKSLAPFRALRRLWAVLRHRVSGLVASAREAAPLAWLRERLRRTAPGTPWGYFRLGAASPREQVLFYYLSLLRRAGQQGFGRRPPQSPRDYEPVLQENLPDHAPELEALTAAFEETRYSAHPVTPAQAQETRSMWQRVRTALNGKKRDA